MHDDFAHCGPLQGQYSHTHATCASTFADISGPNRLDAFLLPG